MTFALTMALAAAVIPLVQQGPYLFVDNVRVNGAGPFRFLLDTGAQSSAITPEIATRARVIPDSRVELVTAVSSRLVLASRTAALEAGDTAGRNSEILILPLDALRTAAPDASGVLGNDFLSGRNYLVDLDRRELILDPPAEALIGDRLPAFDARGRLSIDARVDGRRVRLVLDSGAPALVLFGDTRREGGFLLHTNAGQQTAVRRERTLTAGGIRRTVVAYEIAATDRGDGVGGLLPISALRSVYVNQQDGYLILDPAPRK